MSTFSSRRALIKGAAALTVAGALGAHHAGEQGAQAATLDVKTTPLTFKITEVAGISLTNIHILNPAHMETRHATYV